MDFPQDVITVRDFKDEAQTVKVSAYSVADPVQSLDGKISWRRKWQPTPVLLPEKSHEWRSLVGYSPWGHKESDTTERLHFTYYQMGFPDSSVGKKSTCNAGDPWVEKIPWSRERLPMPVF